MGLAWWFFCFMTVIEQHAEPNTLPTRKSTFCNSTRTGVSQLAPVSARYSALWTATRLPHHRLHATHASRSRSLHLLLVPSQARVGAALLVQSAPPDLVMHHAAMPPLPFPHHAAHRQVVDEDQDKRELAGSRGTRINCSTWGGVQVVCPFQWCPPRWSRPPRASFLRLRVSYTHLQTVSLILPSILSPRTTTLPRQCSACRGSCRNPKCIMPIMPIPPILKPIMPYG